MNQHTLLLLKQIISNELWIRRSNDVRAIRQREISAQIRRLRGQPNYLLLGDSNAWRAKLRESDGLAPINAGIGGALVESFLYADLGLRYARVAKPQVVIVSLGLNDARKSSPHTFRSAYLRLLDRLGDFRVCLDPIPAIPGHSVEGHNAVIREIAETKSLPLLAPLPSYASDDSLHFDAGTADRWANAIAANLRY